MQTAAKLVLEPIFEADFLESSYGFRKGKNATQAMEAIRKAGNSGFNVVLDADIEKFFDSIDQEKLVDLVARRISDRRVAPARRIAPSTACEASATVTVATPRRTTRETWLMRSRSTASPLRGTVLRTVLRSVDGTIDETGGYTRDLRRRPGSDGASTGIATSSDTRSCVGGPK